MGNKSVFCISTSEAQASEIINELKQAGFSNNDISALLPDKTGTKDFAHVHHTKAPEGATMGGLVGGALCGSLGWVAGVGILAIPGLGPFIAAGPIMAALSGSAVGAAVGGLVGALVGFGVPEYEAKRYAGKTREGNILISVHCGEDRAARQAKSIFDKAGAKDIATTGEASVKDSGRRASQMSREMG
jgi:hypothetical protein